MHGHNDKVYPDIVSDQSDNQLTDNQLIGYHETEMYEAGKTDLHRHLTGCKKNPGHKEFIPIGTFSLEHLPEGHRDKDLYDFIKAVADLTVRVDVRMTSEGRPEVWPQTNTPYPFYNIRNSTNLKLGSGLLYAVWKYTDGFDKYESKHKKAYINCWCKTCEGSDSPSNVWWEFDVDTATHVVFDDVEARHTSLRLFYDRSDSPAISIEMVNVDDVNIEHDKSRLKCVTCDISIGDELEKMWKHYLDLWRKVWNKYQRSRDVVKLTFIVSHPHGCSKQVSVGQWMNKYNLGGLNHKFTYTTCTCPGSSGAHVHCVGYDTVGWTDLVHSGRLRSGLNYSGVGGAL